MPTNSKDYMKKYLANKHAESIVCEDCGGRYKQYFKKVHCQSQKHILALKNKEPGVNDETAKLKEDMKLMRDHISELQAIIRARAD
jgi:hypothetical protein